MRLSPNLVIAFALAASPASLSAADYFVSPAGSDQSAGSRGQPWRTIQHGCDRAVAGDTVRVLAGTYREKIQIRVSGRAGAPISLVADGAAVISGSGVKGADIIHIENRSHVRITGFEIRDNEKVKDGSGIRIEGTGSGIEIRNCRIHEIRGRDAMGITVYGSSREAPLSDIVIDGCEIFDCDPAKSEALTLNGNITGFKVTNNSVHDVNNIGIDFIGGEGWVSGDPSKVARKGLCKGNRVFRCRSSYGGGYAAGIYVDGGQDIVIEDNVVAECDLGIEIGAENKGSTARGITVRNNLVHHNDKAGIAFGGYEKNAGRVSGCSFTGNTCYQNDRHKDANGELWIQWASDNTITGNIFWCGENGTLVQIDPNAGANTIDGNRYYTEAGAEEAFFLWRDEDVEGFAAWRKISQQDAASVFEQPVISLPAAR